MAYVAKLSKNVSLVYNSDLSGMKIHIYKKENDSFPSEEYKINDIELFSVFLEYIKSEKIARIQSMSDSTFIKELIDN
jgi:hypothetical protein